MFQWSMAGGGVVYILLGTVAVALYGIRTLGAQALLAFLVPAIAVSLSCELLGTSSGFPFGDYSYLNGLGYKIAGLVPFTIPLSWFYLGLSAYLLARGGCYRPNQPFRGLQLLASVALGSVLLMAWDFVLDPAMSQTAMPFWYWHQPGEFFGMPYQNFFGWFGTGVVFMGIATLLWRGNPRVEGWSRSQLTTPLVVYLANFTFAAVMSMAAGFWLLILLGLLVGAGPAILCWRRSDPEPMVEADLSEIAQAEPAVSVGVATK
ncbi:carotenoid biosynthesis protein, partial [filamentous cyanobacterium CCP5]